MNVEFINEQALANGDLSRYDTIVVGIRAYLSRDDLLRHNGRLNDYVKKRWACRYAIPQAGGQLVTGFTSIPDPTRFDLQWNTDANGE